MRFFIFILFISSLSAKAGYYEPWGKDVCFTQKPKIIKPQQAPTLSYKISNKIIELYQDFLSPVSGSKCQFRPTCSRYMQLAIKRYGFAKGTIMGFDRLLRCDSDDWVYRVKQIDDMLYKFEPAKDSNLKSN